MNILFLTIRSKYVQGALIGLIAGYFIGSLWVGKSQDEMIRQLSQALQIATGG